MFSLISTIYTQSLPYLTYLWASPDNDNLLGRNLQVDLTAMQGISNYLGRQVVVFLTNWDIFRGHDFWNPKPLVLNEEILQTLHPASNSGTMLSKRISFSIILNTSLRKHACMQATNLWTQNDPIVLKYFISRFIHVHILILQWFNIAHSDNA